DGVEKAKELDEHKALAVNNVEGLTTTGDLEASAVRLATISAPTHDPTIEFRSSRTSKPRAKLSKTITEGGVNKTCETVFEGGESKEMRLSMKNEGLRTGAVQTE
ncbi:unnamed protein product, partial [Didymodactylos carnosus]